MFLKNLVTIFKSDADLFYFTISQTKWGNLRDLLILKVLEIRKRKCLVHLHGGYYRKLVEMDLKNWQRKANYNAIQKLDGVVVLGDSLKSIFRGMIDEKKIFTVPNCVDDEFVMNDEQFNEKEKNLTNRDIKHVLFLSNMIRSKGYETALQLAREEKERCNKGAKRKYHFDFCGKFFTEDEEVYFNNFVKKYGLEKYVTYHGVVIGAEKRKALFDSDIFILPTRYPNEGQPISIIEAMANGLFIITTDHAGIPDLVKDGVNGLVIKEGCSVSIEMLDCAAIADTAFRNRKTVLSYYTEAKYIENMERCFEVILNR